MILLNSDNQYEKYREVNIFLETYIKTATNISLLEYKEIEYIVSLNLELQSLQEIENLHLTYINQSFKKDEKEQLLRYYFKEFLCNR